MTLIKWRDEFSIGIPAVDHEHRELIDLINDLHGASGSEPDDVAAFLGEVLTRISAHFALEETTMRAIGYDRYGAHKADHERLLDDLRDMMDAVEANPSAEVGEALGARLSEWFGVHFRTEDARLHTRHPHTAR
jgi:hemerythrin